MRQLARIPRAGRICFLVAFVNLAIWTVVIPPFQVPDEIAHFAYAQYLAEAGRPPPQGPTAQYSNQEYTALNGLYFFEVIGHDNMRGILTSAEDAQLRGELATNPSPLGPGGSTSVTNQPPLYYTLEAIPYLLSPSQDILARLELMRLLSAMLGALTVLAVYLFLRELMPGTRWAWTVGALMVAFQPTFCFISAGVQGDSLLFLAATSTFLGLLRAYRRGLTLGGAAFIGVATVVGVLGKLTFIALVPGIALALALLGLRTARGAGIRNALAPLALASAIVVVPVALYALLNVAVWHRGGLFAGGLAVASSGASALPGGGHVTLHKTLDYTWELYLPRLPFMNHTFFTTYPLWTTWLDGSIGHFGWLDYTFPAWVYEYAQDLLYGLAALALVGLVRVRSAIVALLPLFACFAVMAIGLLGAIGYAGVRYRLTTGYIFEQARYLFPLLVFYALFTVLAARGLPRRWAPILGGLLVVLAMAHGLFAEALTISRYYG